MKWYYKWRLNRIHAEIDALKKMTAAPLLDNYTGHSRLRSLSLLARHLEERLGRDAKASASNQAQLH
jgi:hypothetical protein